MKFVTNRDLAEWMESHERWKELFTKEECRRRALELELAELRQGLSTVRQWRDELGPVPVAERERVEALIRTALGSLPVQGDVWKGLTTLIEMERRMAHVEAQGEFDSDREAHIALGRELGIERLQLVLLRRMALAQGKESKQ